MKIYAPVKDANGVWASVRFVDGVGETNNPALVEWFRQHGYRIEKSDNTQDNVVEKSDNTQLSTVSLEKCETEDEVTLEKCDSPDFDSMTPNQLRDWAKANGLGGVIKNTRNKDKLLELIKGVK